MDYRKCLFNSLAKNSCGLNQNQLNEIFAQFDRIAKVKGDKDAFSIMLTTFGNENEESAMQSFASINYQLPETANRKLFREALEDANKYTIENNGALRVKRAVDNFNKNIYKLSATLTNWRGKFELLTPEDLAQLEIRPQQKNAKDAFAYNSWGSIREHLSGGLQLE